jgi:CarD family transcriptional regulator
VRGFAASRRSTWSTATCRRSEQSAGKESEQCLRSLACPGLTEEDTITELMEEQLKDLEDVAPLVNIEFEIGDSVVYPHHGAGKVIRKEQKEVLGESREYLTIKILHNDMTVMVPTGNAAAAGLRRVMDEETVKKVLALLQDECSEMPKNWNRRFKHNRDKIKTGDIYELAEVVRNLATREAEKGLSTGEKQMFTRAKKILASELMYALEMEEDEVEQHIHHLIIEATDGDGKVAVAAK